MVGSPLKNEFLAEEAPIDNMMLLPREVSLDGWLLSTSTMVYSKRNLSIPRRPSTSSDSDTGLTDDQPSWSGSDTTVEDHQLSDTELWDSFFEPQEKEPLPRPFYPPSAAPLRSQQTQLSFYNRNFACSDLPALNIFEGPPELRRSEARPDFRSDVRPDVPRTPHRKPRTPKSLPHNTYSPFPTVPPKPEYITSSHVSWPLRQDPQPQRPPVRARAHTTSADCKPLFPSNLSTCTTLDGHSPTHSTASSSSSSALYMRSPPTPPDFPSSPLMGMMEKSYFDDDSDDEESGLSALASKFSKRTASSTSPTSNRGKELRTKKSMKNLRAASDAFKGMFGMKKGGSA